MKFGTGGALFLKEASAAVRADRFTLTDRKFSYGSGGKNVYRALVKLNGVPFETVTGMGEGERDSSLDA